MAEALKNFGYSHLFAPIANTDPGTCTIVLEDAELFPTTGDFRIRIDNELILCSGRTSNVITMSDRGIENTTAATHEFNAEVFQALTTTGLETFITERVGVGDQGIQGDPGWTVQEFRQDGEVTLATGTEPFPLPFNVTLRDFRVSCSLVPTQTDVQVDVLIDTVSLWADPNDRPILPVGQYNGTPVVPDSTDFDLGGLVTVDITQVGLPSSGGGAIPDVRSTSVAVSSFTAFVTSFTIPIPPSYQVGDLLLCIFAIGSDTTSSYPTGWVEMTAPVTTADGNLHLYMIGKIAVASESALQVVTLTGGTTLIGATSAIKNPEALVAQPDDEDFIVSDTPVLGITLPLLTTGSDNSLGMWAYAARLTGGDQQNWVMHGDITEDFNDFSERVSTANVALAFGHIQLPTAGDTAAYEATITNGDTSGNREIGANIAFLRGPTGDSPGENISVFMVYGERL